jgi:predicted phosphodiesterase
MHHHLFHRIELERIAGASANDIGAVIEHRTLKLHNKRKITAMLKSISTHLVLHGHVHFTGGYDRDGFTCLNGAGAIYPTRKEDGYKYHVIELNARSISVAIKQVRKSEQQQSLNATDTSIPSFADNSSVMLRL